VLNTLQIQNFRCFQDHEIHFGPFTIAVGQNNAGKTTVSEALRLVSLVTARYRSLQYKPPPNWLDLPRSQIGVAPSLKGLEINFESIFHRYGDPPATITARFDASTVVVHLGREGKVHAVIYRQNGKIARTRAEA
jgi:hypothetical protein